MGDSHTGTKDNRGRRTSLTLLAVLILALAIRLYSLPRPEQALSCDERNYIFSGAVLWEGMLPSYKIAPAGITTWTSWLYCAGASGAEFIRLGSGPRPLPLLVRPYQAIQDALFDIYRDPIPLKLLIVFLALATSLLAVAAAFKTGEKTQGLLGGIISAGIVSFLPMMVQYSVMPTPYLFSWAFAIFSLYFCVAPPRPKWVTSGIMLGISIASRLESSLVLPIILWELLHQDREGHRAKKTLKFLASVSITAFLVSPWLAISLLEIMRTLLVVRLSNPYPLHTVWKDVGGYLVRDGIAAVILAAAICAPMAPPARRRYVLVLMGYVVLLASMTFLRNTIATSRYDGPLYVSLVLAAPVALGYARGKRLWLAGTLAAAGLCLAAYTSCSNALYNKMNFAPQHAVSWIEHNVPAGTRVYMPINTTFTTVLPTPESSNRLWENVNSIPACGKKFRAGAGRLGIHGIFSPRSYCEEIMHIDRTLARRWFVLGGERTGLQAPRYDLRPYPVSFVFGPTMTQALREFLTEGGVFVAYDRKVKGLDKYLVVSWESPSGRFGEYIYVRKPNATAP